LHIIVIYNIIIPEVNIVTARRKIFMYFSRKD
jgi:hypothetical protein